MQDEDLEQVPLGWGEADVAGGGGRRKVRDVEAGDARWTTGRR
ncbi:MAG: hypothetical protein JWP14_1183 [Frankiales bacterium]|nr:hypothetical protein [Frankiales bacterium]